MKTKAVRYHERKLTVHRPVIRRLRLELVAEDERRAGGDPPGAAIEEAPRG